MPQIWEVRLTGMLPAWVSAEDVILEMLRRHGVAGGVNRIIEYHGPGLSGLSAMDRHVIANMGAELGATTSVFPADAQVRAFLAAEDRAADFVEIGPDPDAGYDVTDEIDLSRLVPLIALPGSPDNVVPVADVVGEQVYQVVVGSSANPGLRDFAIVAAILRGRQAHPQVSVDINPTSRQILADLTTVGATLDLIQAGAAHPPGRLPGLYRHGPGTRGRPQQPAYVPPQLPRPFRYRRGRGVAGLAGDRRRGGADRPDHRPPHAPRPARRRLPVAEAARLVERQHRDARTPAATRPGTAGRVGQGAQHRSTTHLRPAARQPDRPGRPQGRRRRVH
jgi:hypothetical protein